MGYRKARVESALQRAIGHAVLRRVADPRVQGMVSVTAVKVSPDLHEAQVFVSVMPAEHEERALEGLQCAAGLIQSVIGEQVAMRQMPRLAFRRDASLKTQAEVTRAIDEATAREQSRPRPTEDPNP
jgi:ribosome-binding factor A